VRKGYLYEPVESLAFKCILSNPPVSAGMTIVKAIITGAPEHMAAKATFQMVVKSKIWGKRLRTIFEENFENVEVSAIKSGYRVLMAKK
jgi:16S rRNA (guanine1207-N2)-methyltransferase